MDRSVTDHDPTIPGEDRRWPARESLRFNQLMGLLIVLGAVGAIIWLTLLARTTCSDPDLGFVAYVPGIVELRADTRVEFYEQCVGRITSVEPGVTALQLEVERRGTLGDRESFTVSTRDPERTAAEEPLTIRYESSSFVRIESAGTGPWSLTRGDDGFWSVDGPPLVGPGVPIDGLVRPGTRMTFGTLDIEWADIGRFTRIAGSIDASAFERVARNVGLVPALQTLPASLGAGTAISVGSSIGIGTSGPPKVRLAPSYRSGLLVAESAGAREFSPEAGIGALAFLGDAVDYLSSPSKTDAPPVNRYERMIDDFNGSLSEMRAAVTSARKLADTLGAVADGGGDQLAGRLIVGQRQLGVLESALGNIDSVLTTIEASVNSDPDRPPLVNLLFDDEQAESLDQTVANVRSLSEELRDGSQTVFTRIAGQDHGIRFDSIVVRTDRLSERANSMLDRLEADGGGAARSAKIYGIVTAVAQALSTIAVIGIWR